VSRALCTVGTTITAIPITQLRLSLSPGAAATSRAIASVTSIWTPMAPLFAAARKSSFVVVGVYESIGPQPPSFHQTRLHPEFRRHHRYLAAPRSPWTPMTVPISPSPATAPAKAATEQAGRAASDWVMKFELKLNQLSPDMSAASALLEQEGFRVDSGNKSATGWFLTAHNTNQRRGSIRLQSDGTKIVVTVAG
jgi:hypothetical protein